MNVYMISTVESSGIDSHITFKRHFWDGELIDFIKLNCDSFILSVSVLDEEQANLLRFESETATGYQV